MKWSEIMALPEDQRASSYLGVEVDGDIIMPPVGVRTLSVVYKGDKKGIIHDDVLDVLVASFIDRAPRRVFLEIPAKSKIDIDDIMGNMTDAQFNLVLCMPEDRDDEKAWDKYKKRLEEFTKDYFTRENLSGVIMPVTSLLRLLFKDVIATEPTSRVILGEHKMDIELFRKHFNEMPTNDSKVVELKQVVRDAAYEAFGGKDEFEAFVRQMTGSVQQRMRARDRFMQQQGGGQQQGQGQQGGQQQGQGHPGMQQAMQGQPQPQQQQQQQQISAPSNQNSGQQQGDSCHVGQSPNRDTAAGAGNGGNNSC